MLESLLLLGQLERTFETLTMAEAATDDTKQETELDTALVKEALPEEEMLAMGLPISFGSSKQAVGVDAQDSASRKRR